MLERNAVAGVALSSLVACGGEKSPNDDVCLERVSEAYLDNEWREDTASMLCSGTREYADDSADCTAVQRVSDTFRVSLDFGVLDDSDVGNYRALLAYDCDGSYGVRSGDFTLDARSSDMVIGRTELEAAGCGSGDIDASIYLTNYRDKLSDCDTAYGYWTIDSYWDDSLGDYVTSVVQYTPSGSERLN